MAKEKDLHSLNQSMMEQDEASYVEQSIVAIYGHIKDMDVAQREASKALEAQLLYLIETFDDCMDEETLLEIAELHKRWLAFYWPKYTKESHLALSKRYRKDIRFHSYYNKRAGVNAIELLIKSIELYTKK